MEMVADFMEVSVMVFSFGSIPKCAAVFLLLIDREIVLAMDQLFDHYSQGISPTTWSC